VTSNLPFDEWTEVFGSERLTGALLDRLTQPSPPNPVVDDDTLTVLATLGMGFTSETDPRPTRAAATNHFIDLYLTGR
jgi:hypothetical protein